MTRREKIRIIRGLVRGLVKLEELSEPEVEVWVQTIDGQLYKHFGSDELVSRSDLQRRESPKRRIIMLDFVEGKTIL